MEFFPDLKKQTKIIDREQFEKDLSDAIEKSWELMRLYRFYAGKISTIPAVPLVLSAYLTEARIGFEEMAKSLDKNIDWLKKIRAEAFRLEELSET